MSDIAAVNIRINKWLYVYCCPDCCIIYGGKTTPHCPHCGAKSQSPTRQMNPVFQDRVFANMAEIGETLWI